VEAVVRAVNHVAVMGDACGEGGVSDHSEGDREVMVVSRVEVVRDLGRFGMAGQEPSPSRSAQLKRLFRPGHICRPQLVDLDFNGKDFELIAQGREHSAVGVVHRGLRGGRGDGVVPCAWSRDHASIMAQKGPF